jgi:hypothetical protein
LLAGISAASAAPPENGRMAAPPASTKMAPPSSDTLTLTSAQRKKAWDDLYTGKLNQKTPSGFNATVGVALPSTIVTAPVTARAAGDVPALKPYKFAMVQEKLVIVNPSDGKIVDVITRLSFGVMAGHGVSRTASLSPLSPAIPLRSTPPR